MIGYRRNRKSAAPWRHRAISRSSHMASSLEEKMKNKKQKTEELQASLPNSSRSLRILVFTRAQLPSSHVLETGGLTGMIIFNNNGSTGRPSHRITRHSCGCCWPSATFPTSTTTAINSSTRRFRHGKMAQRFRSTETVPPRLSRLGGSPSQKTKMSMD